VSERPVGGERDAIAEALRAPWPWERDDALGEAPATSAFGCWTKKGPAGCTEEELREVCERDAPLVWTPARAGLVCPVEVPALFEANRAWRVARAEKNLRWAYFSCLLWCGLFGLQMQDGVGLAWERMLLPLLLLGVLPAATNSVEWWRARRWTPELMAREAPLARFHSWVAERRAAATWSLVAVLLVLGLWAMWTVSDGRWAAAALNKPAVRAGEWWRLGTGPMVHANGLHLFGNLCALAYLGRLVEAVYGWRATLVVLAAGLLGGSVASQLALDATSVGFSGAILGLLGFGLAADRGAEKILPAGQARAWWTALALTALIGVVGMKFIDNAAHAGGALVGAAVGWLYQRQPGSRGRPMAAGAGWTTAGAAGGLFLLACAAGAAWRMARG
jgi:membrane associated rhomboid family serine protease